MTTSSLPLIARQIAVSHDEKTVLIELICTDEYGALVLYDDILSRLNSDRGLMLSVRTGVTLDEGASS